MFKKIKKSATSCLFEGRIVRWAEGKESAASSKKSNISRWKSNICEAVLGFVAILIHFLNHFNSLPSHIKFKWVLCIVNQLGSFPTLLVFPR